MTTVRRRRAKVRSHSRTACAPALACAMCAHSDGWRLRSSLVRIQPALQLGEHERDGQLRASANDCPRAFSCGWLNALRFARRGRLCPHACAVAVANGTCTVCSSTRGRMPPLGGRPSLGRPLLGRPLLGRPPLGPRPCRLDAITRSNCHANCCNSSSHGAYTQYRAV